MLKQRQVVASIGFDFSVWKQVIALHPLTSMVAKVSHLALGDSFFNFSIFALYSLF